METRGAPPASRDPRHPARISRRDLLRGAVLAGCGAVLAACGLGPSGSPGSRGPAGTTPATGTPGRSATPAGPAPSGSADATTPRSTFLEIVGRPTDRSATVSLLPAHDGDVLVEHGTAPGAYTTQTTPIRASAGVPVQIEITGLAPDRRCYWRVRDGNGAGLERSFVTQRPAGSTFTFTLDSDPHNGDPNTSSALLEIAYANAAADRPDFHVNLGDTFMTEKLQARTLDDVVGTYVDMRPHLAVVGGDAPLFLVNGNHEGELGWLLDGTERNLATWCTATRRRHYPNPVPGGFYSGSSAVEPLVGVRDGYYAFTWGDALLVALDPYWYTRPKPGTVAGACWGWTLGLEQHRWLRRTLEASRAKHKLIFTHQLVGGRDKDGRGGIDAAQLYEWGGRDPDGTWAFDARRPGWGAPIHRLLVDNGVRAVFHGHDHVYVRQQLDGITYQECPQPSMARYDNTQMAADYGYTSGDVRGSSGHLRITVSPATVRVDYVRAYLPADERTGRRNGAVDISYTI